MNNAQQIVAFYGFPEQVLVRDENKIDWVCRWKVLKCGLPVLKCGKCGRGRVRWAMLYSCKVCGCWVSSVWFGKAKGWVL